MDMNQLQSLDYFSLSQKTVFNFHLVVKGEWPELLGEILHKYRRHENKYVAMQMLLCQFYAERIDHKLV